MLAWQCVRFPLKVNYSTYPVVVLYPLLFASSSGRSIANSASYHPHLTTRRTTGIQENYSQKLPYPDR